jgi:ribosomal protein L35
MSIKGNKSFSKRIKVTRTGKLIARKPGQNHFNAKEAQSGRMSRRRTQSVAVSAKTSQRYITTQ